jgi:hypothetical protein
MPGVRERDYRQRRYMRLDMLVRAWARSCGLSEAAAALAVATLLRRCPESLVVECRSLEEINRGIPALARAARRMAALERIEQLVADQCPLTALKPFVVRTDRLMAALIKAGEPVPGFLPLLLE